MQYFGCGQRRAEHREIITSLGQLTNFLLLLVRTLLALIAARVQSQNHRITESQNGRGWEGPLWVI